MFSLSNPHHPQSALAKKAGSPGVILRLIEVLTAVEFDDQIRGWAVEIHDERSNGRLPPPFPAAEPSPAQLAPKATFGVGPVGSKRAGALKGRLLGHRPPR
ncbi:MAG TPA: hypothetical protein VMU37_08600 [Caulobacteraceae bacterium]|nr:hypothetical protein [Caulobacteraceae bacterium]